MKNRDKVLAIVAGMMYILDVVYDLLITTLSSSIVIINICSTVFLLATKKEAP